jgi:Fe-S oxidoreductase
MSAIPAAMNETREAWLDCVHCGLCLSSCPTYRVLGNEMDSPRGRIYLMRALDEGRAAITDTFVEHMFRCLDCRACETACPSGVRFGHMMEATRGRIVDERGTDALLRFVLERVFPYPRRFHWAAHFVELYRRSGLSGFLRSSRLLERLAPEFAAAEAMSPEVPLSRGIEPGSAYPALSRERGTVAFFSGCVMNSMLGATNRASVGLLRAAGFRVVVPEEQICCGALANHAGLRATAADMARRNLEAFPLERVDAIVVNASGCGAMLAEYPMLVADAGAFSSKVRDLASVLASGGAMGPLSSAMTTRATCCMRKGCASRRGLCWLLSGASSWSRSRAPTNAAAAPGSTTSRIASSPWRFWTARWSGSRLRVWTFWSRGIPGVCSNCSTARAAWASTSRSSTWRTSSYAPCPPGSGLGSVDKAGRLGHS